MMQDLHASLAAPARIAGILVAAILALVPPALGAGVVTNCANDADFSGKLAGGGTVTFACGTATIILSSTKAITAKTTIDGGGTITLSGGNAVRLFSVASGTTLNLNDVVLSNGFFSGADGGAIVNRGTLNLTGATVKNSQVDASHSGGAIVSFGGAVNLTDSALTSNQAGAGGALFVRDGAAATIIGSVLDGNHAVSTTDGDGGAVEVWTASSLSVVGSRFTQNTAKNGGAIFTSFTDASIAVNDCYFAFNTATEFGGAIYSTSATATVGSTYFDANAAGGGGAITIDGSFDAVVTIAESGFSNNTGGSFHGAVRSGRGTVKVKNSTLVSSELTSYKGTYELVNDTLVDSPLGFTDLTAVTNTVFLSHGATANCEQSPLPNSSFNLSNDGTCGFGAGRDNVDLTFTATTYNGLPTYIPSPGNPAIDGGTSTGAPSIDQRGTGRPQGAAVDVGAIEVCAVKPGAPVIVKPHSGRQSAKARVRLRWTQAECATDYDVTVRLGSANGVKVFTQKAWPATAIKTTPLSRRQTYFWQVSACNSVKCTPSNGATFSVK